MARATDAGEKSVTGSRGFLGRGGETAGMREGVVIAGGRSTRFGERDKAVAPLAGVPMIRRVAERVGAVTDRLVVNCRADQRGAIAEAMEGYESPVTFAIDRETDGGPMAGIRTGLAAVEAEYAAVVACDMPFVEPGFIDYLFDRAAGHDAAVPRREDGWYQTTQAVFRARPMVDACDRALERGERKIVAPLFDLEYVVVTEEEIAAHASVETFENVNTEAELRDAADRLTEQ
jgi:molybdenum cofactor guanylyltransferase